jgi:ribosomal protein S18 acetylase RimI-like enzyme
MIISRQPNENRDRDSGQRHLLRQPRLSDRVELRPPNKSDYESMFEFKKALYDEGFTFFGALSRESTKSWVDWAVEASAGKRAAVTVASTGKKIAGVVEVGEKYYGEGYLVIAVAEGARGQGVGDALVGDAVKKSGDLFTRVVLNVNYSNLVAQGLYRKHGFTLCRGDDGPYLNMELVLRREGATGTTNP